jgi:hypothetical protein
MLKSATRLVTQRRKKANPSNLTFASRAASPGPWRVIHHDSGLEHAYQDDDQGGQHDEDGDEVDGDDPLALGRDASEGFGAEQGHGAKDGYHLDHYDREDVVEQVHEGCLQAYLRILSDDRERRENRRERGAEVGADGDRVHLRRGQDA